MVHAGDRKILQFPEVIFIINEKPTMDVQPAYFDILLLLRVIRRKGEGGGNVAGHHLLGF